jgi:5-methylcytosine-specific restriction endonuclease McrA
MSQGRKNKGNRSRNAAGRRARKRTLLARDGGLCWICGRAMPADDMSVDHVVELSEGGSNLLDNLRLAHGRCNSERSR